MRGLTPILVLFVLLKYASIALAHSGGTDAQGCHTDSKTGDYHCHNDGSSSSPSLGSPSMPSIPTREEQRDGVSSLCSNYALCMEFGRSSLQLQRYSLAMSYFESALLHVPQDRVATVRLSTARSLLQTVPSPSSPVTLSITENLEVYTSNVCLDYESCMQMGTRFIQLRTYAQAIPYFEVALLYKPQDRSAIAGLNIARSLQPKILPQ